MRSAETIRSNRRSIKRNREACETCPGVGRIECHHSPGRAVDRPSAGARLPDRSPRVLRRDGEAQGGVARHRRHRPSAPVISRQEIEAQPARPAREEDVVPASSSGGALIVSVEDLLDVAMLDHLRFHCGLSVLPVAADADQIRAVERGHDSDDDPHGETGD
ncbi:GspE/PulE/PilB domain-containing protein [Tautonia sociabilis]|uniref:GspE/PulE/PilB domain-containing protein n=1 Tax=Tautonia sociabilis TaxID=2080755 RepID=UPI0013155C20|nr:hypothetical protein [Tautonia sociabilis]